MIFSNMCAARARKTVANRVQACCNSSVRKIVRMGRAAAEVSARRRTRRSKAHGDIQWLVRI